ncbi:MAG: hypothetical protein QM692_18935 [Thermomicrobiales bacterium]
MDAQQFARLLLQLRQALPPATRRGSLVALPALAGSALALLRTDANAADNRHRKRQRREQRQRRRRQRREAETASELRPISFEVVNPGPNAVSVEFGDSYPLRCCHTMLVTTVQPGASVILNTTTSNGYFWIAAKYWFGIINPTLDQPYATVAVNGQWKIDQPGKVEWCCQPQGTLVVEKQKFAEPQMHYFEIEGKTFALDRLKDSNYKVFQLFLPSGL